MKTQLIALATVALFASALAQAPTSSNIALLQFSITNLSDEDFVARFEGFTKPEATIESGGHYTATMYLKGSLQQRATMNIYYDNEPVCKVDIAVHITWTGLRYEIDPNIKPTETVNNPSHCIINDISYGKINLNAGITLK